MSRPLNASATTSAASPIATTRARPDRRRGVGHRRQVETLVAAAGDQHDVVEAGDRHRRGVRRGGLGVVVPGDAVGVADELDAVRRTAEARPARRRRPSRSASRVSSTSAAAARPFVRSWGSRRRRLATGAELAGRADEHASSDRPFDAVVGVGRAERDVTSRSGGESPHHLGVAGEADRDVVGTLVGEDLVLGVAVGVHRAMPVEVVGSEVQPRRGLAAEPLGEREPEAGALDDERVEVHVDRRHERNLGVAGRHRAACLRRPASRPPTASWSSCRRCR